MPYHRLAHELQALDSDIYHAAETARFFHYRADKGAMVVIWEGVWGSVLRAFPSAREDIRAAVDCFAMEHNHASIYHCMMVLEYGLPALAKRLRVSFNPDKATWASSSGERRLAAARAFIESSSLMID